MPQNNSVSFFAPGFDDAIEQSKIERQRKLAEAMMQQSQTPTKGQMVGNIYVPPSWTEGLAKVLGAYQGGSMQRDSDTKQTALADAMQTRNKQEAKDFFATLRGTPERPSFATGGNEMGDEPAMQQATPAVPGDQNKAIEMAFNAKSPMVQGYGSQLATGQLQQQQMMDQLAAAMKTAGMGSPGGGQAGSGNAPGAPAGGGSFGGVNPLAAALTMSGNPTLGKLGGMVADASKPIPMREGDLVVPDGNGGFVSKFQSSKLEPGIVPQRNAGGQVISASAIPGYAPAVASIKGAEAGATSAAQAGNDLVTVDLKPDPARGIKGGPTQMTRAQAVALSAGQGGAPVPPQGAMPSAGGVPPMPRQPQAMSGNPPAGAGMVQSQPPEARMGVLQGQLTQAQQMLQTPLNDADRQRVTRDVADIQNEMAMMQRGGGAVGAPSAPGAIPTSPGIAVQSDEEKAYGKARATDFAKHAATVFDNGQKATGTLGTIGALRNLYADPNVVKGGGAEFTSGLKNAAAAVGVNIQGLGAEQAIESITNKMALDSRSTAEGGGMPGAMSDSDRKFLSALTPNLSKTPEGRAMIMQSTERLAQRQIEIAKLATAYEQQNGKLDVGFQAQLQQMANAKPLFADIKIPQGAAATAANHPPAIQNILKKYSGGASGSW